MKTYLIRAVAVLAVVVIGLRFWAILGERPESLDQVADGLTSLLIAGIVGLMITYGRTAVEQAAEKAEHDGTDN